MTGSTLWQQSRKEEHALGEAEYNATQAKGYAEGLTDCVGGYKDSVVGAIKGDKAQQVAGEFANTPFFFDLAHPFVSFTQVTSARRGERSSKRLTSPRMVGSIARGRLLFGFILSEHHGFFGCI